MAAVPFFEYLHGEGLTFGLSADLLNRIQQLTEEGLDLSALLGEPDVEAAGVVVEHLLRLRRAFLRYRELCRHADREPGDRPVRSRLEVQALRWAGRVAPGDEGRQVLLAGAFSAVASATLKRGRMRMHLARPDVPRAVEVGELAEHTEGCSDIPPHRWFKAGRAVADGLLWIEVIPPQGEAERALGRDATRDLVEEIEREGGKPVLDAIARRAEREAISTAAEGVRALLSRPRLGGVVGGVAVGKTRIWTCVLGGEHDGERAEFDSRHADRVAGWLERRCVECVGISRVGGKGAPSGLIRLLSGRGLMVEPVREAGLMKQARGLSGPVRQAAAEVVARRLKDPVEGYSDLEPDELGLGEYLDRVDAGRLRAALDDARQAAVLARPAAPGLSRGVTVNPMVKSIDDLRPGIEMTGTVVNLTHFGAFVELGLEVQGLVHLSELSGSFVKHPSEVVQVGQQVRVRVLQVEPGRSRVSLSMRAGTDARRGSRSKRSDAIEALDDLFKK